MSWDPDAGGQRPAGCWPSGRRSPTAPRWCCIPRPAVTIRRWRPLLAALTDARFPAADGRACPGRLPRQPGRGRTGGAGGGPLDVAVRWVPPPEPVAHFTGRAEELARLDRWAADPQVAPGRGDAPGAGRGRPRWSPTGSRRRAGSARRPGYGGCSGGASTPTPPPSTGPRGSWSGRNRTSAIAVPGAGRLAGRCWGCWRAVPVLLVLDGLEVVQEGPAGEGFGRLLDGLLREVLAGACQLHHAGLVVLTSRFPFADLEAFDGGQRPDAGGPRVHPGRGRGAAGRRRRRLAARAASGGTWWRRWTGTPWPSACWPGCSPPARPPPTWPPCARTWPPPPAPTPGSARCWASTPPGWPRRTGTCSPRCRLFTRPVTADGGAGRGRARGVRGPAGRVDAGHGGGGGAGAAGRAGRLAPRRHHLRPPLGPRHLPPPRPPSRRHRRRHQPDRAARREE